MNRSLLRAALIPILLSFAGCTAPPPPTGDDTDTGNGISSLPETTKILAASTLQDLETVSADQATFTFRKGAGQLASLQEGDIIVADVSEPLLPEGTLRRITGVEDNGTQIILQTVETGLAQAVGNGELHGRIPLTLADEGGSARLVPKFAGPGQLVFPFNDVVLFDGDKNEDTTDDQIIMNGTLTLEPEVIIDIEISNFTLQKATIEVVGDTSASVTIEARRQAVFNYEDVLLTVPFPKVVIPLGPIPVVFIPILEIRGGANGTFSADMTADILLDAETTVGLGYDGSFGPILEVDPSGSANVPSFLDGAAADGEVWLSARFKVSVYGLAGVYAESRFYGKAHVDVDACPWWDLRAGVAGSAGAYAGISVELLIFDADINIFEWSTDPLKEEKLIAEAEGCAPSATQSGLDTLNWARSYGADNLEYPVGLAVTADGGAVITGTTYSYTPGQDAFLMKTDALGHVSWQVAYDDLHAGIAAAPLADGYWLLAGEHDVSSFLSPAFVPEEVLEPAGDPPAFLLRLDPNGAPTVARAFAATDALDAAALGVLPDGSAVVAGTIGDPPNGQDVWVGRFDAATVPVWTLRLSAPDVDEEVQSLLIDSAGNIVALATSQVGDGCDWVIKLDADGNLLWQSCYGGEHNDWAAEIVEVPGGYMVVGSMGIHAQVNRLDYDGNLLWARHIDSDTIERDDDTGVELQPDDTPYDQTYSAAAYANGDVLVAGKHGLGAEEDFWYFRLDGEGSVRWMRSCGGDDQDAAGGFTEYSRIASTTAITPDGGALIAGYTASFTHATDPEDFDLDVWVVKVRSLGTVDMDESSGASAGATFGEVDTEITHYGGPTSATVVPLDLLHAEFTPVVYSPSFDVAVQGGLE